MTLAGKKVVVRTVREDIVDVVPRLELCRQRRCNRVGTVFL